jgi:hypothetical protein
MCAREREGKSERQRERVHFTNGKITETFHKIREEYSNRLQDKINRKVRI